MPRSWARFSSRAAALLAAGLAACGGDGMAPEPPFQLPEENLSTDPAALRLGDFWYPCGRWKDFMRPTVDYLLADLLFDTGLEDGLTPQQRAKVEKLGAVILREWHVEGARVLIPTDSIPRFDGLAVRTVPDLRRYDATMVIRYKAGVDWPAERQRILELGGLGADSTLHAAQLPPPRVCHSPEPGRPDPSRAAQRHLGLLRWGAQLRVSRMAGPCLTAYRALKKGS